MVSFYLLFIYRRTKMITHNCASVHSAMPPADEDVLSRAPRSVRPRLTRDTSACAISPRPRPAAALPRATNAPVSSLQSMSEKSESLSSEKSESGGSISALPYRIARASRCKRADILQVLAESSSLAHTSIFFGTRWWERVSSPWPKRPTP